MLNWNSLYKTTVWEDYKSQFNRKNPRITLKNLQKNLKPSKYKKKYTIYWKYENIKPHYRCKYTRSSFFLYFLYFFIFLKKKKKFCWNWKIWEEHRMKKLNLTVISHSCVEFYPLFIWYPFYTLVSFSHSTFC